MIINRTERGWAGHFICANRCRFRRNTLLEYGAFKVVVSTVGLMEDALAKDHDNRFLEIGYHRHFETMVFHAKYDGRYWDPDVTQQVSFDSPWCIAEIDADDQANDMHEAVVSEIMAKLQAGAIPAPTEEEEAS